MGRLFAILAVMAVSLAACGDSSHSTADGPRAYKIRAGDTAKIQNRALEAVNIERTYAGLQPLTLNPQLTQAANSQARDMSGQNRPWWFGSDASNPMTRAARYGYAGQLLGEVDAETYEDDTVIVAGWFGDQRTRPVLMEPAAREMGFGWYQEGSGKIWWTLVTGSGPLYAAAY